MTNPPQKKWQRIAKGILKYSVYFLLFIITMQAGQLWQQRDAVVGKALAISALDINGRLTTLSEYSGKPVLLYFWASWCPVCRFEHDAISNIAEDYEVLGIAMQSGTDEAVRKEMLEHKANYRVINDPDGVLASKYGVRGVPTSFIIDQRGDIRATLSGFTTEPSLRYRMWRLLPDKTL